jgi:plastocyanin
MSRLRLFALALLCCAASRAATFRAVVNTPAGQAVEDAAVVLEPLSGKGPEHHVAKAIQQIDREFVPYLTVVQTGTAIDFPNRDPIKHHVYSFSPAKVFEIKLYAGKPVAPVLFDKPGVVALGCNIHDWMEAYVLVVDSPWFAKTGKDGRVRINDVPPGRYRLRLWQPRQKAAFEPFEVKLDGAGLQQQLTLDVSPRLVKAKPPLDNEGY